MLSFKSVIFEQPNYKLLYLVHIVEVLFSINCSLCEVTKKKDKMKNYIERPANTSAIFFGL